MQQAKIDDGESSLLDMVDEVESRINQIIRKKTIDIVMTQATQKRQIYNLLWRKVPEVYHETMIQLYEGKYLERYREYEQGEEIPVSE